MVVVLIGAAAAGSVLFFFRDPDFTGFSLRGENTVS
jgi:hypothetical protein